MLFVMINGYPGVGKLTIARLLSERMQARLLDNHTLFNAARAVFVRTDPNYGALTQALATTVFDHLRRDTSSVPLILTGYFSDTPSNRTAYGDVIDVARHRRAPMIGVTLTCAMDENARRILSSGRAERFRLSSLDALTQIRDRYELYRPTDIGHLDLDVTHLTPPIATDTLYQKITVQAAKAKVLHG